MTTMESRYLSLLGFTFKLSYIQYCLIMNCLINRFPCIDMYLSTWHTIYSITALPLNICLIDLVGRRWTGAVNLFGCGLFFILLQLPVPKTLLTVFMFVVRGFSSGMFNFVYIYTSEVRFLSLRVFLLIFFAEYYLSHRMTKPTKLHVRPAKTQISLGIHQVWSESVLCNQWVADVPSFLHADIKDSAECTCHFVGFVMHWLIYIVSVSFVKYQELKKNNKLL